MSHFFLTSSYIPTYNSDRFIYATTSFIQKLFLSSLNPILVSVLSLWMVTVPSSVLFPETREM